MINTIVAQPTIKVKTVTLEYDRYNSRQVLAAIKSFYDTPAKEWTIEQIKPFLADDVDAEFWHKSLRNTEYALNNPKPKSWSRSRGNRKHNNAERIAKTATFDALMAGV